MAGLPSRAGERCAVEQRHRTMTTCHQGRARNASALRPPQAAQPDGRAGCVAAKPPFSTANGGGSVHEPAGPAVCSTATCRGVHGLVARCTGLHTAPSCPGQGGGKGVFDAEAVAAVGDEHPVGVGGICHHLRRVAILGMVTGESSSMVTSAACLVGRGVASGRLLRAVHIPTAREGCLLLPQQGGGYVGRNPPGSADWPM